MSGIMVGRNCARYENSTSWDPRVRNPHDFPNRDMKAFSIIHPRDHGVRKVLGKFLQGKFEERGFQDMDNYYCHDISKFVFT